MTNLSLSIISFSGHLSRILEGPDYCRLFYIHVLSDRYVILPLKIEKRPIIDCQSVTHFHFKDTSLFYVSSNERQEIIALLLSSYQTAVTNLREIHLNFNFHAYWNLVLFPLYILDETFIGVHPSLGPKLFSSV
jgi:hypothetical protein